MGISDKQKTKSSRLIKSFYIKQTGQLENTSLLKNTPTQLKKTHQKASNG